MDIINDGKVKIVAGTKMVHKDHGKGICSKVDYKSRQFRYLFKFEDETLKWMSDEDCAQMTLDTSIEE